MRKPSQNLVEILAHNIKEYRRLKELSQEKFAEICGLHRTYIGSVERGERNVSLSTLEVFASVLGVSVPDLLTSGGVTKADSDRTRK
jgi:transcriptional regulator with XRE-family HTH domain